MKFTYLQFLFLKTNMKAFSLGIEPTFCSALASVIRFFFDPAGLNRGCSSSMSGPWFDLTEDFQPQFKVDVRQSIIGIIRTHMGVKEIQIYLMILASIFNFKYCQYLKFS